MHHQAFQLPDGDHNDRIGAIGVTVHENRGCVDGFRELRGIDGNGDRTIISGTRREEICTKNKPLFRCICWRQRPIPFKWARAAMSDGDSRTQLTVLEHKRAWRNDHVFLRCRRYGSAGSRDKQQN